MADNELNPSEVENNAEETQAEEAQEKLSLTTQVEKRSACERHITVTISRKDVDRFMKKECDELMPVAQLPGFRPGHAPRKLVESRFHKDVTDRVKSALLMEGISQVNDDEKLAPISDPELEVSAVTIPEEGDFTFEYNLEVRPEFEIPQWKGIKLQKPVREFTDADVEAASESFQARLSKLEEFDGEAASGDYIATKLTIKDGDKVLNSSEKETIRLRPQLLFSDATLENFDEQMAGVKAGETRTLKMTLSQDAPNFALRGKEVAAEFEVQTVYKLQRPDLAEFIQKLGFETEEQYNDFLKRQLQGQLEYQQEQVAREGITALLLESADWELPPALLERQAERELYRTMLELQRQGFSAEQIRSHLNILQQNSREATKKMLKEHFILERIAEEEKIDASDEDYDLEVAKIAAQTNDSPRRVRARLEKQNRMDILRNQIVETKVIKLIMDNAEFEETPYEPPMEQFATLDYPAGGSGDEKEEAAEATEAAE